MTGSHASLTPLAELSAGEIERWQELADAAEEPNPFAEPGIALAAADILPTDRPALLVARERDEWVGALPVQLRRGWRGSPIGGTIGWNHLYSFLGTPLLRRGAAEDAARTLLAGPGPHAPALVGVPLLGTGGPVGAALDATATGERTSLRHYERAFLRRRDDPAGYVALRPKHRREFRRLGDRLAERLDASLVTHDESDSDAALETFLKLEASGWKGRSGTAFETIGHAGFFRQVCRAFRERGRLQLLVLRAGKRPLAAKCNFRGGEGAFCFKIGFDDEFARFSPGIQLELGTIARFHDDATLQWLDSCAEGSNEMINRLWPDRRSIEIVTYTRGIRGAVARTALLGARQAREMTRRSKR